MTWEEPQGNGVGDTSLLSTPLPHQEGGCGSEVAGGEDPNQL